MKKLIIIILLLQAFHTFAASVVYKVASSGNDANNGITAPWKTLAKVNAMQSTLNAGDMVLFNRGDIFYGNLIVSKSGTSGNPIIYGAYGTGAMPIITGFTNVTSFTQISTNIWESNTLSTNITGCNLVNINGVNVPMGRIPNTGYYTYSSHTGSGTGVQARSITSPSLNSAITNWTGAELALCMSTYTIGRDVITSASGSTINFTSASVDEDIQKDGQRFIIQNDQRTLDTQGEWYYNPATKKIRIYSVGSPTGVQVSTIDTTVNISTQNYITIDGIDIQGANQNLIFIGNSNHITIQNSNLNFSGRDGIFGPFWNVSTYLNVNHCTINNVNNTAIDVSGSFTNNSITDNTITNCGQQFGMGNNGNTGNGLGSYSGILIGGGTTLVQNNSIDNIAYNGIRFHGDNTTIQNNFINHSCNNLTDGGAIYTDGDNTTSSNLKILGNIALNGGDNGIYLDAQTNNVEVANNTLSGFVRAAYFINQDHDINLHDNTAYDNLYGLWVDNTDPNYTTSNITITGNKFIGKSASQTTSLYNLIGSTIPSTLLPDYNYYARPIDDNLTLLTYLSGVYTNRNLAMWQTLSGKDLNSKRSPIAIPNVNLIYFYYNTTDHDSIFSVVPGIDMSNTSYSGTTVIPAYGSLVLLSTGALITPNITWTPATLTYPNGLGPGQLNAIAKDGATTITGTHTYSPGTATVGNVPGISVKDDFTPADPLTYSNATKTVTIPVSPQSVTLAFSNLNVTYDGNAHLPTLTATPNAATSILLDGVSGGKINAGTYTATGAVTDPNSTATPITATFTINKGTATITAVNQQFNYDGLSHTLSYTTFPLGLNITHSYSSGTAPSAIGVYTDTLKMVEANYQAAPIVRAITIVSNPATIFISDTLKTYNGSAQSVTVTSPYSYTLTNGTRTNAGTQQVIATINDGVHTGSDTANLTVAPKQAILSWNKPQNAPYGTLFSTQQLNATADVLGDFTYNYSIGQIIPTGITTLSAVFTPSSSNYVGGTITTMVQTYTEDQLLKFYLTNNFFLKQ